MEKVKSFFDKLKYDLQNLVTLTKMQSKQKVSKDVVETTKQKILGSTSTILKFMIITALTYVVLYVFVVLRIFSLTFSPPIELLSTVFIVMQILAAISCTRGLLTSLYFSGDNQILLTLPVKSNQVFLSKMVIYYVNELKRNTNFLLPIFVAFGLISDYSLLYYPALVVLFLFISLIPVLIGVVLSVPLLFITIQFRKNPIIQSITYISIIVILFTSLTYLINQIPENLDIVGNYGKYFWSIQELLINVTSTFPRFDSIVRILTDVGLQVSHSSISETFIVKFGILVFVLSVFAAVLYFAVKPLFFRMVTKPFEFKGKKSGKSKSNKVHSQLFTSVKKQIILKLRSPDQLIQSIMIIFTLPLAILLLNTLYAAMNTRILGNYMTISFNILIILLILLTSNERTASSLSRDGDAIHQLKTTPVNVYSTVISKFSINLFVSFVSLTLTTIVLTTMADLPLNQAWSVTTIAFLISIAHILWSVEMDILNPQYRFYKGGTHQSSNPNQNKSVGIAFLLSFFLAFWTFFLLLENESVAWIKLIVLCIGILAVRMFFFISRVKAYFREI